MLPMVLDILDLPVILMLLANFVGGYVVAGSYVAKSIEVHKSLVWAKAEDSLSVERKVKYDWTEHTQCSPMNKTPVLSMI